MEEHHASVPGIMIVVDFFVHVTIELLNGPMLEGLRNANLSAARLGIIHVDHTAHSPMMEHIDHSWGVDNNRDVQLVGDVNCYPRVKVAHDQIWFNLLDFFLHQTFEQSKPPDLMVVVFRMFWWLEKFFSDHAIIDENLVLAVDLSHNLGGFVAIVSIVLGDKIHVVSSFDKDIDNM